ncbi:MAG: FAD-dependent monooxygenase [Anaerolineae bacterium]
MQYDVIIAGSGPAGASTALHLAHIAPEVAQRTLILEKAQHPRPKLCGGGLLQDGEFILQRLGMDVAEAPHVEVKEAHFRFEGRGFFIARQPVSFRVFARDLFDKWLIDTARKRGIALREETRVLKVVPHNAGVTVETNNGTYTARAVVGADGSLSAVRRAVPGTRTGHTARLLEFYIPPEHTPATDQDKGIFDYKVIGQGVQGYVWDFPMLIDGRPARNRGIFDLCMYDTPRQDLRPVLRQAIAQDGIDPETYPLLSHPIRWFDPADSFAAPHILLVGDAAGVDPSYGEGISFALGYGELAAHELKSAFAQNDFSFSGYKARILNSRMGVILKRRRNLAAMLYGIRTPNIQRLIWWRLNFLLKWYVENFLIDWAK